MSADGSTGRRRRAVRVALASAICAYVIACAPGIARAEALVRPSPPPATQQAAPTRPLADAIHVAAGATCLDREVLIRRVVRWLRREEIDARLQIEVQGSATRKNAASFVIVHGAGQRAERRIDDAPDECDQFHSALALSIALAIDATLSSASNEEVVPPPPPAPEGPRYFKLAFGVLAHATAGVLTDISGALSARVEVGFLPWLDLRASFMATALRDQVFSNAPGRFDISLLAGQLDACLGHAVTPSLRLVVCAGGAAGALRTEGREDLELAAQSQTGPWFALDGSIEAQAELLSWLALVASVDLVVPLAKQRIVVAGTDSQSAAGQRELTAVGVLIGAGPVFRVF